MNPIKKTDSYKVTHWKYYPDSVEGAYSHFMARYGSKFPYTLFNGLQPFLYELRDMVKNIDIPRAQLWLRSHFGQDFLNTPMWFRIQELGYFPVTIKAAPEGARVQPGNVLMSIESEDPVAWPIVQHLETILTHIWYPCNVGTISHLARAYMAKMLRETADPEAMENHLPYMLHDFGFRGATGDQAAERGAAAHLISFKGTDTMPGIEYIQEHYTPDYYVDEADIGVSIPATEHSVMTILGPQGEFDQVQRFLDAHPTGPIACVADSYDIEQFCDMIGTRFKKQILERTGGPFVVRPDSGDPCEVTMEVLGILEEHFGTTKNSKGYKVLPPQIRMIWGDGIDLDGIKAVLTRMRLNKWSAENISFGMGGGLLQKHNRDTQRFAFKLSSAKIDGQWRDVYKDPRDSNKQSRRGRLKLLKLGAEYNTVREEEPGADQLRVVFENGNITMPQNFLHIRDKAKDYE